MISYPDLTFDPINLYNLPYQKVIDVQDYPHRTCTRILWRVCLEKTVKDLVIARTTATPPSPASP